MFIYFRWLTHLIWWFCLRTLVEFFRVYKFLLVCMIYIFVITFSAGKSCALAQHYLKQIEHDQIFDPTMRSWYATKFRQFATWARPAHVARSNKKQTDSTMYNESQKASSFSLCLAFFFLLVNEVLFKSMFKCFVALKSREDTLHWNKRTRIHGLHPLWVGMKPI